MGNVWKLTNISHFFLTLRPALLLCLFINERAVSSISRASRNFLASLSPCFISALQPPHVQPFAPLRLVWDLSHPHLSKLPTLHACVMAYTTPEELIADQKAASLLAEKEKKKMKSLFLKGQLYQPR